jgi:hypothetical protein
VLVAPRRFDETDGLERLVGIQRLTLQESFR